MKDLTQQDFTNLVGEIYYFYRFKDTLDTYEICLEPCLSGFDVAIYKLYDPYTKLLFPKKCTNIKGYEKDYFGLDRRDKRVWNKALKDANNFYKKINERTQKKNN